MFGRGHVMAGVGSEQSRGKERGRDGKGEEWCVLRRGVEYQCTNVYKMCLQKYQGTVPYLQVRRNTFHITAHEM